MLKKIIALLSLLGLFSVLRLTNLTLLPIFTDEAIYIRWSQIGSRDAAWRFISLTDGKQPMFTWILMVLLKFLPDPLFAGRLVSVLAGAASLGGLWLLSYTLFKKYRVSFLTCFLYIISPFSLMYDRMALYDSLVATFSIWNLYLGILLVKTLRLDIALILGMMLSAGMLNKTSGFLSLYLLPLTLLLFDWKSSHILRRIARWAGLVMVSFVISQVLYSVLRLSPLFHMVGQKDSVFVYPFAEWIDFKFRFLYGNLRGLFDWMIHYLTIPVFILCFMPWLQFRKHRAEIILLYAWWGVPILGLATFARILYPRFILFMTVPLLVLGAYALFSILSVMKKKALYAAIMIILFLPSIMTDILLITNPGEANIPQSDKGQYIEDWPSGWGVREVNAFLLLQSERSRVSVYTEGTFGLLPYAIEIYLVDNPHIKIQGIWPLPDVFPSEIARDAIDHPTYVVLNQSQEPPPSWPLSRIAEYVKGGRTDRKLRLYKVVLPLAIRL